MELTGYSREEVVGTNCRFLQGPRSDAKTLLAIRDAVRRGEGITVKLLNYKKDRTVFWNLLCIVPDPPSRSGPPGTVLGPQEIFTAANPYGDYCVRLDNSPGAESRAQTPVPDWQGRLHRFLGCQVDITADRPGLPGVLKCPQRFPQ